MHYSDINIWSYRNYAFQQSKLNNTTFGAFNWYDIVKEKLFEPRKYLLLINYNFPEFKTFKRIKKEKTEVKTKALEDNINRQS